MFVLDASVFDVVVVVVMLFVISTPVNLEDGEIEFNDKAQP